MTFTAIKILRNYFFDKKTETVQMLRVNNRQKNLLIGGRGINQHSYVKYRVEITS